MATSAQILQIPGQGHARETCAGTVRIVDMFRTASVRSFVCRRHTLSLKILSYGDSARTEERGLEVALVAAEVDEAQHAGGPGRHLRRRQRRHARIVEHTSCTPGQGSNAANHKTANMRLLLASSMGNWLNCCEQHTTAEK